MNTKKFELIANTYDYRCPHIVLDDNKKNQDKGKQIKEKQERQIVGLGCVICEPAPIYCPYFDTGKECQCQVECDFCYDYKPNKIYKTKIRIKEHLQAHKLKISDKILDFYRLKES